MPDEERGISYREMACIAEELLEKTHEDETLLAREFTALPDTLRRDLLVSDFFNAYQVFYYYFKQTPGELEKERLILQPASALVQGVMINERELLEIIFRIEDDQPVMSVSDGDRVLVNFRGIDAYERALRFIDEAL
ncbi:MAG: hypothetical protein A4E38_01435 [Methanoregulaceae archaeon PtaB.Bin108]|nr:MAG: hypothetical protein A4E38_01435 [Methanoregulaceae archaeon PtaB.Bin108]OPY44040.1 MAG: hypothetical protein A4E42_01099 [Methanoregulaceae archaeon PtaU1.Bin222]